MLQRSLSFALNSPYIPLLLLEFHYGPIRGHVGICRTYTRVVTEFYWKGIKKHVQNYVTTHDVYQHSKHEAMAPVGML